MKIELSKELEEKILSGDIAISEQIEILVEIQEALQVAEIRESIEEDYKKTNVNFNLNLLEDKDLLEFLDSTRSSYGLTMEERIRGILRKEYNWVKSYRTEKDEDNKITTVYEDKKATENIDIESKVEVVMPVL